MQAHAFYKYVNQIWHLVSLSNQLSPFSLVYLHQQEERATHIYQNRKRERKEQLCREVRVLKYSAFIYHREGDAVPECIDSYFLHAAGSNTILIIYDWRFLGNKNPIKHPIFSFSLVYTLILQNECVLASAQGDLQSIPLPPKTAHLKQESYNYSIWHSKAFCLIPVLALSWGF